MHRVRNSSKPNIIQFNSIQFNSNIRPFLCCRGRDSSVGIATRYGLEGLGIESRWRRDFPHLSRTGPGAHPASCTMGTASFPGVKRPGRDVVHPPHLVPRSRKSRAIPLFHLWVFVACYRVKLLHLNLSVVNKTMSFLCNPDTSNQLLFTLREITNSGHQIVET